MSDSGLSDLNTMHQTFRLKAHSYVFDILEGQLEPILARTKSTGPISSRKLVHRRYDVIFQHDSAPVHTAVITESWFKDQNLQFWGKGVGKGNSQDIYPIENLWSILKDRINSLSSVP
ncbi:unnamed protein product [Lepeophtheirus salmonis]|uniref:(salmon louse) hypothetical protein n=1 Tax=Lepeophtheirus salmonis TaxID=72036 RepID=A0A7R8CW34_LEPSM|nr:unnamed protein product [Lepeophtheirus salmonis]CAF2950041.1 unnamed protein product [Lepeophtheirus salmonis]